MPMTNNHTSYRPFIPNTQHLARSRSPTSCLTPTVSAALVHSSVEGSITPIAVRHTAPHTRHAAANTLMRHAANHKPHPAPHGPHPHPPTPNTQHPTPRTPHPTPVTLHPACRINPPTPPRTPRPCLHIAPSCPPTLSAPLVRSAVAGSMTPMTDAKKLSGVTVAGTRGWVLWQ